MKNIKLLACILFSTGILIGCDRDSEKESIDTDPIEFTKDGELRVLKPSGEVAATLDIEISDDNFERETGLMHRASMDNNQAMLFIFGNAAPRFFYMKNTLIPLDIIYFGSDSTAVSFQKNAKPMDLTLLPSGEPAKFVLEINAGLADEWNLQLGDKIEFEVKQ